MQRIAKQALLKTEPPSPTWAALLHRIRDDMLIIQYPEAVVNGLQASLAAELYAGENDLATTMLHAIPNARTYGITGVLREMRDTCQQLGGKLFQTYEQLNGPFQARIGETRKYTSEDVGEAWRNTYTAFVYPLRQAQQTHPRALGHGLQGITHIYTHGHTEHGRPQKRGFTLTLPAHMRLAIDLGYLAYGYDLMLTQVNPEHVETDPLLLPKLATNWQRFKRAYVTVHGVVAARQH